MCSLFILLLKCLFILIFNFRFLQPFIITCISILQLDATTTAATHAKKEFGLFNIIEINRENRILEKKVKKQGKF